MPYEGQSQCDPASPAGDAFHPQQDAAMLFSLPFHDRSHTHGVFLSAQSELASMTPKKAASSSNLAEVDSTIPPRMPSSKPSTPALKRTNRQSTKPFIGAYADMPNVLNTANYEQKGASFASTPPPHLDDEQKEEYRVQYDRTYKTIPLNSHNPRTIPEHYTLTLRAVLMKADERPVSDRARRDTYVHLEVLLRSQHFFPKLIRSSKTRARKELWKLWFAARQKWRVEDLPSVSICRSYKAERDAHNATVRARRPRLKGLDDGEGERDPEEESENENN